MQLPKSPISELAVLVAAGAETETVTASVLVAVAMSVASTVTVTIDCQEKGFISFPGTLKYTSTSYLRRKQ